MTSSFGANFGSNASATGRSASGGASAGAHGSIGGAIGGAAGAVSGAMGMVSAIASLIPAMIVCVDEPTMAGIVNLDFNPKEITFTRTAQSSSRPQGTQMGSATGGSTGPTVPQTDTVQIKIGELWFDGMTTKLRCDQLLRWMSPTSGAMGLVQQGQGSATRSQPPPLRFIWGPPKVGFFYKVILQQVTVTYERFNPMGMPVRAKVGLTMKQLPSVLSDMPTNPTSGGPVGRRAHTMHSGDTLQSVAQTYYGNPNAWRMIAAANRIDDPARVRPGTRVFLPLGQGDPAGAVL